MYNKGKMKRCLSAMLAASLVFGNATTLEAATAAKFTIKKVVMVKGESRTLKVVGKKATKWTSTNKKVATVSAKGKVTARKKGTTKIKCKVSKKTLSCTVKVEAPVISEKSLELESGKIYQLKMKGTSLKVKWSSTNPQVATVNSKGLVTAQSVNETSNVTIKAVINKKVYTCQVTVKPVATTPTATVSAGGITVAPQNTGSTQTTATPQSTSGVQQTAAPQKTDSSTKTSAPQNTGGVQQTTAPQDTGSTQATATPQSTSDTQQTIAPQDTGSTQVTATPQSTSDAPQNTSEAQTTATPTTSVTAQPVTDEVQWTVTEEKFMGQYAQKNEETGEDEVIPKELTRKYVSFNPWPTTNEQVEYVIKNCDDPYVVGALYVVALDNYEYKGRSDYSGETFKMLDSLMNGAGAISGDAYKLNNLAKERINEYGTKTIATEDGRSVKVMDFASRAYIKGATPYNDYTPEGGLEDKSKWQIAMDEYVYCGDLENGYITVCPQKYAEEQETEGGAKVHNEHYQGLRIGFRWNGGKKVWLPTDYVKLNTPPGSSPLVAFDIHSTNMFTNNYIAPQVSVDQNGTLAPDAEGDNEANKVEWTVTEEKFMGQYAVKNEETGKDEIYPKELTRKYVSFNPWPTTDGQVRYIMRHCDDPYVIGALYVVALDNYEYKGRNDYSGETFKMLESLMSGAGAVTGDAYKLTALAKERINEYGTKTIATEDGRSVKVMDFASRAYIKGATPENDYTPEGGKEDKTKWQIAMDEYVYCGDLENGYITVCPQKYALEQETESGPAVYNEHYQGLRIGLRKISGVWCPTDYVKLNTLPENSPLVAFDVHSTNLFTNNYVAPVEDQGW